MKRTKAAFLALLLVATGCASVEIDHDFDVNADFTAYKTFYWVPSTVATTTTTTTSRPSGLLDARIRKAVDSQMEAKGFTKNDTGPDVYVNYYAGAKDVVQVTDMGYGYGYRGWGGGAVDVSTYTEGTLVVDIFDSKTKQLVWRAVATGAVDPGASPEKQEANVNNVVAQMFLAYPPK